MGITNPTLSGQTDGKFSDVIGYDKPFVLNAAEVVEGVRTQGFGEGTMVILDCTPEGASGSERKRLGIWGRYLIEQVRSAEAGDFGKVYKVVQGPIEGYSDKPDTKRLVPVS